MELEWLVEQLALVGLGRLGLVLLELELAQLWLVQQPKNNRIIILNLKLTLAGSGAASFFGAAGAAEAEASGSMSTNGAPTGTVSPSSQWYLVITPSKAARISTVTLSVSILAMISSALTAVPTSFYTICDEYLSKLTGFEGLDNTLRDGVTHGWNLLQFCFDKK